MNGTLRLLPFLLATAAACDPAVDRDNPYDPEAPRAEQATGAVVGRVMHSLPDGPAPAADARVEVSGTGDGGGVVSASSDGAFRVDGLRAGRWNVAIRADGFEGRTLSVVLGIGETADLGELTLTDTRAPVAPALTLAEGAGATSDRNVAIRVEGFEPDATLELGGDLEGGVANWPADGLPERVALTTGDGVKRVRAVAVDAAGNRSAPTEARVVLDTTPPSAGTAEVVGGVEDVRSLTVGLDLRNTDATRMGVVAVDAAVACETGVVTCVGPFAAAVTVTLPPGQGPKTLCRALCDDVGNAVVPDAIPLCLGPHVDRARPVLDPVAALSPPSMIAGPDAPTELTIRGAAVAFDTVAEVGPFTLPCVTEPVASDCPTGDEVPGPGTTCTVTLPDALRLQSGRYQVRLRTPPPVAGLGVSESAAFLDVESPFPLIESVTPRGVGVRIGGDAVEPRAVEVELVLEDVNDSARFRLGGRDGQLLAFERDADDPGRVVARVRFDLASLRDRVGQEVPLTVNNPFPGGSERTVAFGLTPVPIVCPADAVCEVPIRATLPPNGDGRVVVDLTLPPSQQLGGLRVEGAEEWIVRNPDGVTLLRARPGGRPTYLPLPSPQPRATVRAVARVGRGGVLEVGPGTTADPSVGRSWSALSRSLGAAAGDAAFRDVDVDGRLDAVVSLPAVGTVALAWGGGEVQRIPVDGAPSEVSVDDLDGDGLPDLLVVEERADAVVFLRNLDDRRFAEAGRLEAGAPITAVAVHDADRDGRAEVFAAVADGVLRWHRALDGRFSEPALVDTFGVAIEQIRFLDFDQDRFPDLVGAGGDGLGLIPITDAGFGEGRMLCAACRAPFLPADIDGDGLLDLVAGSQSGDAPPGLTVVRGREGTVVQLAAVLSCPFGRQGDPCQEGVTLFDISDPDLDGRPEALVGSAAGRLGAMGFDDAGFRGDIERLSGPWALSQEDGGGLLAAAFDGAALLSVRGDGTVSSWQVESNDDGTADCGPRLRLQPRFRRDAVAWLDLNRDGRDDVLTLQERRLVEWPLLADDSEGRFGKPRDALTGCALEDACELPRGVGLPEDGFDAFTLLETSDGVFVDAWGSDRGVLASVLEDGRLSVEASYAVPDGFVRRRLLPTDALYPPDAPGIDLVGLEILEGGAAMWDRALQPPDRGPATVVVADFDGDGVDGVLVEDDTSAALFTLTLDADERPVPSGVGVPRFLADPRDEVVWRAGDMDGDGLADRVSVQAVGEPAVAVVTVHLAEAAGTFAEIPLGPGVAAGPVDRDGPTADLLLVDVNEDGLRDALTLVAAGVPGRPDELSWTRGICYGRGGGLLTECATTERRASVNGASALASLGLADVTGEGSAEIVFGMDGGLDTTSLAPGGEWPVLAAAAPGLDVAPGEWGATSIRLPSLWVTSLSVILDIVCTPPEAEPEAAPRVYLQAPSGAEAELAIRCGDGAQANRRTSALRHVWGRQSAGLWTIRIDRAEDPSEAPLTLRAFDLAFVASYQRPRFAPGWDADDDGIHHLVDACEGASWPPVRAPALCPGRLEWPPLGPGDYIDVCGGEDAMPDAP